LKLLCCLPQSSFDFWGNLQRYNRLLAPKKAMMFAFLRIHKVFPMFGNFRACYFYPVQNPKK